MDVTLVVAGGVAAIFLLIGWGAFVSRTRRRGEASRAILLEETPTESRRARDVVANMSEGIVVLRGPMTPVLVNDVARKMLQIPNETLPARLGSDELLSVARRAVTEGRPLATEVSLWPSRVNVRVRAIPVPGDEVFLYLTDVTEEQRTVQIRRQFVLSASHELKTPVAGLHTLAEALADSFEAGDHEAARRFVVRMTAESDRLGRLVRDLLDLSRLEDPASFSAATVDLSAVVEREALEMKEVAAAKGIDLAIEVSSGIWVRGDESPLGLMVKNLLDNAIRYTPSDGRAAVSLGHDEHEAIVAVSDTGVGIPLNAQSRVFERFFRVDSDRSRDSGGTGLGLAIVKHVAELHGGHVEVQSQLGEGSTFSVRLPIALDEPQGAS